MTKPEMTLADSYREVLKERDELSAELARVRGLLQYYVDVTVRRGTYNAKLEKEAQLETEGAESADIGKLDTADKKADD